MPLYKYDSFNRRGGRVTGTVDAVSMHAAKEILQGQGLMPVNIKEVTDGSAGGGFSLKTLMPNQHLSQMEFQFYLIQMLLVCFPVIKVWFHQRERN